MAKVLILGDLHLGRLQSMFRQWQDWSFAPLKQVENYAKEHHIKHVIQTGDIFDTAAPEQELLTLLIDFLANSPLQWWFISGNHDQGNRQKNSLTLLRYLSKQHKLTNCHFFLKPGRATVAGIPTVFLPWPHTKSKFLQTKPSLVIAHVERAGAKYDNGFAVTDHDFALGRHFWVIGHLHQYQTQANAVFLGAPLQLRNGDGLSKVFLQLSYRHGKFSYQTVPIKLPYRLLTIKIRLGDQKWRDKFNRLRRTDFVRLLINKQVVVPQKYLNHRQVINHDYVGKANKAVLTETKQETQENALFSRQLALQVFLGKLGMSAAKQKMALAYAAKIEADLGIG